MDRGQCIVDSEQPHAVTTQDEILPWYHCLLAIVLTAAGAAGRGPNARRPDAGRPARGARRRAVDARDAPTAASSLDDRQAAATRRPRAPPAPASEPAGVGRAGRRLVVWSAATTRSDGRTARIALLDGRRSSCPRPAWPPSGCSRGVRRSRRRVVADRRAWSSTADLLVVRKDEVVDYHKGVLRDVTDKHGPVRARRRRAAGQAVEGLRPGLLPSAGRHAARGRLPDHRRRPARAGRSASLELAERAAAGPRPAGVDGRPAAGDDRADRLLPRQDRLPQRPGAGVGRRSRPIFGTAEDAAGAGASSSPRARTRTSSRARCDWAASEYAQGPGAAQPHRGRLSPARRGSAASRPSWASTTRVRPRGNVRLVIRGDDQRAAGGDGRRRPIRRRPIDLDLTGVRRLTILVDFGDETGRGRPPRPLRSEDHQMKRAALILAARRFCWRPWPSPAAGRRRPGRARGRGRADRRDGQGQGRRAGRSSPPAARAAAPAWSSRPTATP